MIAACGGGDGEAPPPSPSATSEARPAAQDQAQTSTGNAEAQSPGEPATAAEAATPPAPTAGAGAAEAEADTDSTVVGEAGGRGLIAGIDTNISSVALGEIHYDLFNGSSISLVEAEEATILRLVDAIPPLDANRALLAPATAQRVGEVVYTPPVENAYLADDALILGYVADDGQAYAFPIGILNFHELVNDTLGGRAVLVSYCPLCRSGVIYERQLNGQVLTFGNSSALFQNDLVMFDRQTNSYWFQTGGEAVVGTLTGARLTLLPSTLLPWASWLAQHPETLVLSTATGFPRDYARDPFGGYAAIVEAGRFPFPVAEDVIADDRLPLEELVLGVEEGGVARAFPLGQLGDAVVHDTIGGVEVVVFSAAEGPTGNAFDPRVGGQSLSFGFDGEAYTDAETGTRWSLSGKALSGPLAGSQLTLLPARTAFWFSYRSAQPEVVVFEAPGS